MPDYLRTISKVSNATENKEIKLVNSIIQYYYIFNKLSDKVNSQMKMKAETKPLNLLGKFKVSYDKENLAFRHIVFSSPTLTITIIGSFINIDGAITYNRHREVRIITTAHMEA
jgi:hypothetical protein